MSDMTLWVEQYRPKTLDDCILSERLREIFQKMRDQGEVQNLMFVGPAGTGKTSVAKALAKDLGMDTLIINGSENSGIDILRTEIRQFASTASFTDAPKLVLIDEAEYLNPNSTQPAFRAFVEEFSSTCRFILCANYPSRLIPEIHSRFPKIDFTPTKSEKKELATQYAKRVKSILIEKGVSVDKETISSVVVRYFPDLRSIIGAFETHTINGEVRPSILGNAVSLGSLVSSLKSRDYENLRQWVVDRGGLDAATLFREIYEGLLPHIADPVMFITLLAKYQFQAAFVMDQEVNTLAFLSEVMKTVELE